VVKQVKSLEFALLDLNVHFVSVTMELNSDQHHNVGFSKQGSKLEHVRLVVDNFALNLRALDCLELTTTNCVPGSNDKSLTGLDASASNNLVANFDHSLVNGFRISSKLKTTVLSDVRETIEHVGPRDADLVKHQPSIVLRVVAKLGSNITNLNALEWQVSVHIPDGNEEALNAEIVFSDFALSEDGRMISPQAQAARPVLGAGDSGRVNDKFVSS
jgi:hypothetical protein